MLFSLVLSATVKERFYNLADGVTVYDNFESGIVHFTGDILCWISFLY